jgi:hypothetical protein
LDALSQRGRCRVIEDVDGGAGRSQAAEDLVVQSLVGGRQAGLVDRDGDLGGDGARLALTTSSITWSLTNQLAFGLAW